MLNKFSKVTILILLVSSVQVCAQDKRVEVSPLIGYTISEGISFTPVSIPGGALVDSLTPTSGFTWGFLVDFLVTEQFGVGFQFTDQTTSTLEAGLVSGGKSNLTDMNLRNYHAMFTYNWGDEDDPVRPFFFGGLGATQYSPDDIMGNAIDSNSKFSSTWGAGVKVFTTEHLGFSLRGRWTPTYISSDPSGIWCSPYWPFQCWVVGEANYAHQGEFSGSVIFRF